jgi:hypothetical protein
VTTYPLIQSSLSPTQAEFIRLVGERVGAYQYGDAPRGTDLPGDTVLFSVVAIDSGEDLSEHRHVIAFRALTRDGRWMEVGSLRHTLKQTEAMQVRHALTESSFEISGLGAPDGRFPWAAVERIVQGYIDALEAARLLPAASGRAAAQCPARSRGAAVSSSRRPRPQPARR